MTIKDTNPQESFAALLDESIISQMDLTGTVMKGTVVAVTNDTVTVDVGLGSEGVIPIKQFQQGDRKPQIKKFDIVDVYVERMEDREGVIVLSHEKARREASWRELEVAHQNAQPVNGIMFGHVKGGFTVDINGAVAFLPKSHLDVRPVKDINALMNVEQQFIILKMDRARGNIVVSRRAILEESRTEARGELLKSLHEGMELEGLVKNITEYGAFIDLGGVDGLLHITDMSWRRLNHPTELIQLGDTIKVVIIRHNRENDRISLGMKQLEKDPWEGIADHFKLNQRVKGCVTNIQDYGAFIEIKPGVEGLIHVSEMSWTKKNMHPGKFLDPNQEVEAIILEIDMQKRRIALGLKQTIDNPWQTVSSEFPIGKEFVGKVRNITEFGLFIALNDDLDGIVHISNLSWDNNGEEAIKNYKVGDEVRVKVLEVDPEKERIGLGVKQLSEDPLASGMQHLKKNDTVTCEIQKVMETGLEVIIVNGQIPGFIKKVDLAKERSEQRSDRFAVKEKVDAKIMSIDPKTRKANLSIKAREISEEKEAMAAYGSTDSGASLGDILGAALGKAKDKTKS